MSARVLAIAAPLAALAIGMPARGGADVASGESGGVASDPADYLAFDERLTSDCMIHRARLREIRNTHPSRIIRVELVSYTGRTRSQGTSRFELAPDAEPTPLGCDAASGLDRRWEIVDARFAD